MIFAKCIKNDKTKSFRKFDDETSFAEHLVFQGVQPGHCPNHHGPHLLVATHAQVTLIGVFKDAKTSNCRVFTSLYEALSVQAQMTCEKKGMDYLPLWFLYSIVVMNILLVINASSNFLIYLFAGNSFRDQVFSPPQPIFLA